MCAHISCAIVLGILSVIRAAEEAKWRETQLMRKEKKLTRRIGPDAAAALHGSSNFEYVQVKIIWFEERI